MKPLGRTIRLFLVDGSPLGLVAAEIMGWTGKILSFPRGLLPDALRRPEIAKTGLYFLVGPDPENPMRPLVYVGESDDVAKRLKQHDSSEDKDFFEQVALLVSKDENLTKSHVRYLETRLIEIIRGIGSATLKNGNQGSPVLLPEAEQADMEFVLEQLKVLLPVLGMPFLQDLPKRDLPSPISNPQQSKSAERSSAMDSVDFELSFMNGLITAEAYQQEGQLIVKAGSMVRHPDQATASVSKIYAQQIAQALASNKLAPVDGDHEMLQLTEDLAFKSPSTAGQFVCGTPISGPWYWKVKGSNETYGDWRKRQMEAVEKPMLVAEEALV